MGMIIKVKDEMLTVQFDGEDATKEYSAMIRLKEDPEKKGTGMIIKVEDKMFTVKFGSDAEEYRYTADKIESWSDEMALFLEELKTNYKQTRKARGLKLFLKPRI